MVSFLVSSPHNNLLRKVCKKDWLFGVILLILNAAFCIKTFVFLGTEEILESKEIKNSSHLVEQGDNLTEGIFKLSKKVDADFNYGRSWARGYSLGNW